MDAMRFGAESMPLTVRDVVDRHGGEMWFQRERVQQEAFFRFRCRLPVSSNLPMPARFHPLTVDPSFMTSICFRSYCRSARSMSACCRLCPRLCLTLRPLVVLCVCSAHRSGGTQCGFCNLRKPVPGWLSISRCWTLCCCRQLCTRTRSRTDWMPLPSTSTSPSRDAIPRLAMRW
jgi:hypothetical protein